MKNILTLVLMSLLSTTIVFAQPSADASIGGHFSPNQILAGETATLTVEFGADAFTTLPTGEVELTISLPAGGAYINNTDPGTGPTGTAAASFDWFWNAGTKAWAGINNSPIPGSVSGGGGTILIEVLGVDEPTQETTDLEVNYSNDSDDGNDHTTPDLILPVEFSSFLVESSDCGKVNIKWTTESEVNNDKFIVERRIDDGEYNAVGEVKGGGNSSSLLTYNYADKVDFSGKHTIYYRLKQIDRDGRFDYSDVIKADYRCKEEPISFNVYPNPAINIANFEFNRGLVEEEVMIRIYDNIGNLVMSLPNVELDEQHMKSIDLSHLPGGMYQAKVSTDTEVIIKNIIKIE